MQYATNSFIHLLTERFVNILMEQHPNQIEAASTVDYLLFLTDVGFISVHVDPIN
jgi:hypothetical protein